MSDILSEIDVGLNYQNVIQKVEMSASKIGKTLSDITIVGVTKRIEMERIKPALDNGLKYVGEIVGTELKSKITQIREYQPSVIIHIVGQLQSNKTKFAVEKCDLVQSVETENILSLLNKYAERMKILYPIFLQADFSKKTICKGLNETELFKFLKIASKYTSIDVQGLMTIAPLEFENSPELLRKFFKRTYKIFKEKFTPILDKDFLYLSMGMSNDFQFAIEEGANLIRVGTAIFGPRKQK